ncbi:MAG TPA: HAMP domain-containing protein, partial [Gammaproteobacteria bacterium]|nr:HAMP domain-containing protein [Gammaproteobacteria bacterium]
MQANIAPESFRNTFPKQNKIIKPVSIRKSLFFGFASILVILILMLSSMLWNIDKTKKAADKVVHVELPIYDMYLDINGQIFKSNSAIEKWLLTGNEVYKKDFELAWSNINRAELTIDSMNAHWSKEDLEKWENVKNLFSQLKTVQFKIQNTADKTLIKASLENEMDPLIDKIFTILDGDIQANGDRSGGMFDAQLDTLTVGSEDIISNMQSLEFRIFILLGIIFISILIIGYFTQRSITRYVNIYRNQSSRVAAGDLTERTNIESADEMGQLGKDLDTMTDSLAKVTRQIITSTHE